MEVTTEYDERFSSGTFPNTTLGLLFLKTCNDKRVRWIKSKDHTLYSEV